MLKLSDIIREWVAEKGIPVNLSKAYDAIELVWMDWKTEYQRMNNTGAISLGAIDDQKAYVIIFERGVGVPNSEKFYNPADPEFFEKLECQIKQIIKRYA